MSRLKTLLPCQIKDPFLHLHTCLCASSSCCRAGYLISPDWIPKSTFLVSVFQKILKERLSQTKILWPNTKCCLCIFEAHLKCSEALQIHLDDQQCSQTQSLAECLCKVNNPQGPCFLTSLDGRCLTLLQFTNYLVVSTHLKNISQIGNLPQVGVKIKNI